MTALDAFTRTAERAANQVIRSYSTSFGAATRLLGVRHRHHVRNIYALVRVSDELVDGVAQDAGLAQADQEEAFERLVSETHRAVRVGYSSDLVVHAFAYTARATGIGDDLIDPFFDSMRTDLRHTFEASRAVFDAASHDTYVYGSAEVVGLMCLRVFLHNEKVGPDDRLRLEHGARRLGAAFQDVNFLRDLADDTGRLDRSYLGSEARLTATERDACIARIRAQIADAEAVLPLLPFDARTAVRSAASLFAALADKIEATEVDDLYRRRVRVSDASKLPIIARALIHSMREAFP